MQAPCPPRADDFSARCCGGKGAVSSTAASGSAALWAAQWAGALGRRDGAAPWPRRKRHNREPLTWADFYNPAHLGRADRRDDFSRRRVGRMIWSNTYRGITGLTSTENGTAARVYPTGRGFGERGAPKTRPASFDLALDVVGARAFQVRGSTPMARCICAGPSSGRARGGGPGGALAEEGPPERGVGQGAPPDGRACFPCGRPPTRRPRARCGTPPPPENCFLGAAGERHRAGKPAAAGGGRPPCGRPAATAARRSFQLPNRNVRPGCHPRRAPQSFPSFTSAAVASTIADRSRRSVHPIREDLFPNRPPIQGLTHLKRTCPFIYHPVRWRFPIHSPLSSSSVRGSPSNIGHWVSGFLSGCGGAFFVPIFLDPASRWG